MYPKARSQTRHLRYLLPFEAVPSGLGTVRGAVRSTLRHWGASAVVGEAELAVTELATNVIKHVGEGTAATLVLEEGDELLRVEVHDRSREVPVDAPADLVAERGRGLRLLSALSLNWGTLLTPTGKAVWCEIPLLPAPHRARVRRAAAVLDRYQHITRADSTPSPASALLEHSVTELISDLLHWTGAQGRDADDVLDRAQVCYDAERGAG
jgi:anti-sigma regulatory factor (Ser/Thr protein kinase)